jgi:hypothetical protein
MARLPDARVADARVAGGRLALGCLVQAETSAERTKFTTS